MHELIRTIACRQCVGLVCKPWSTQPVGKRERGFAAGNRVYKSTYCSDRVCLLVGTPALARTLIKLNASFRHLTWVCFARFCSFLTGSLREISALKIYYCCTLRGHYIISQIPLLTKSEICTYYCISLFPAFLIYRTENLCSYALLHSKPNLINWNHHFRRPEGTLYGQKCSTHQHYHKSEQLLKCLYKSSHFELQLREIPTNPEPFLHTIILEVR